MLQGHIFEGNKVLAFRPTSRRQDRAVRAEDGERGTLLLFTGVRYERVEGSLAEMLAPTLPDEAEEPGCS